MTKKEIFGYSKIRSSRMINKHFQYHPWSQYKYGIAHEPIEILYDIILTTMFNLHSNFRARKRLIEAIHMIRFRIGNSLTDC